MSSNGSCGDRYEREFAEFLLKRIGNAGGSLQLQHITGHLSQLSYDIRCSIGTSRADLEKFLESHSHIFSLQNGIVRLADSSSKDGGYDSDCSSIEQHLSLPLDIKMGKGVIIKIFPEYGFIKIKEPVKSEAYFGARSFADEKIDLTSCLYIGTVVHFNAKRRNLKEGKKKYFVTKVWKAEGLHGFTVVHRPRKNHETGLYDPMVLESEGIIQKIFPNLGFIAVKGDEKNTVFFHKNRLQKYENIVDLTKVLSKGDLVEFTAHRSTKQDAKARWEATKVWKKSSKMNDDDFAESGSNVSLELKTNRRKENKEMIKSQRGKICPRSRGAVIKFGQNELADGDGAVYFITGSRVTDIGWEFSEGDDVFFDAVKIKSAPGWKAVLVWVGERPDFVHSTCLGDFSEFTDEETDDNFSSYMSNSSNSSTKSVSLKSGSSSSKLKNHPEKLPKLSNAVFNKEAKKYSEENAGMQNSSSRYGSQNSLSSSVVSKSSQRSKKDNKKEKSSFNILSAENKVASCWGDSPYFVSEKFQNSSPTPDNFEHVVQAVSEHEAEISEHEAPIEEAHCKSEHDEEGIKENIEADEFFSSEESETVEETIPDSNKVKASIRKFQCLEGRITKVYSKFAEVNASKLQNTVSFFWNNFYFRGVSVEELELDDLKQVLKVGDFIHFNYFEVIDDAGQNWQKVSLAWNGSKPMKAEEMSPGDFIKQNNLSVSIKNEIIIDEEEEKVVPRKFLAAFEDEDHDELAEEVSKNGSFSDDDLATAVDHSKAVKEPSAALLSVDYNVLLNAVTQILRKNLSPSKSEVDLNSVSEEVIKAVLENHKERKCNGEFYPEFSSCEKYVDEVSDTACANCERECALDSSSNINTKNSEAQTIITGEIIAQSIFTEC